MTRLVVSQRKVKMAAEGPIMVCFYTLLNRQQGRMLPVKLFHTLKIKSSFVFQVPSGKMKILLVFLGLLGNSIAMPVSIEIFLGLILLCSIVK